MRRGLAWGLLGLLLLWGSAVGAQPLRDVPPLQARVTDLTGSLDTTQRGRIEARLAGLESETGAQVAVLIVPSTQPESIEQYALRVAEAWKLGRGHGSASSGRGATAAIDDGLLILVARDDRRIRIEVGYGLEGALPDAWAQRLIRETMAPRFRANDMAGGLEAAIEDIALRIRGEGLPPPTPVASEDEGGGVVPGLVMGVMVGLFISRVAGRLLGALLGGGSSGVATWILLGSSVAGAAAGLAVGLLVLFLGGAANRLRPLGRRTIGHRGIDLPGLGSGWGGGFGGGSGGGGFGGGGGGFGGGGASGDW